MNIWHICLHLMCVMSVVLGNGFDELLSLAKDMLFPKIPSYFDGPLAHVNFVSGGVAEANNELTPEDVKYAPTVKWDSIQHTHYTLCLIEPIPQFWKDLQIKGYLHWLVVNIPSSYVEQGETLAPYEMGQSLEEQTGGNHSYALFVYRQPLVMNYHERRLDGKSPHGHRLNFDFTEFATEYLLYIPEYTNRFWIVYPESKDTLLARLKALELKLNKKV